MSNFFNRDTVNIFPSSYRIYKPQGRFTSEQNFTNIINSIIDDNINDGSYVLDYSNSILKVVIHGYYFEISGLSSLLTDYPNLWLGIKVQQGGYRIVHFDDKGDTLDSDTMFFGLMYSTSSPTNNSNDDYKEYYLKVTESGKIINKARFNTDSIQYDSVNNLTSELNCKQYKLTAGDGIEEITNKQSETNTVKLKEEEFNKLSSLPNKGGNGSTLFYFDSEGKANNASSDLDIGCNGTTKSQGVYILDGVITAGQTIYASTAGPSGGNVGDIWLKYSGD